MRELGATSHKAVTAVRWHDHEARCAVRWSLSMRIHSEFGFPPSRPSPDRIADRVRLSGRTTRVAGYFSLRGGGAAGATGWSDPASSLFGANS
jgi:hypothetical protein